MKIKNRFVFDFFVSCTLILHTSAEQLFPIEYAHNSNRNYYFAFSHHLLQKDFKLSFSSMINSGGEWFVSKKSKLAFFFFFFIFFLSSWPFFYFFSFLRTTSSSLMMSLTHLPGNR